MIIHQGFNALNSPTRKNKVQCLYSISLKCTAQTDLSHVKCSFVVRQHLTHAGRCFACPLTNLPHQTNYNTMLLHLNGRSSMIDNVVCTLIHLAHLYSDVWQTYVTSTITRGLAVQLHVSPEMNQVCLVTSFYIYKHQGSTIDR